MATVLADGSYSSTPITEKELAALRRLLLEDCVTRRGNPGLLSDAMVYAMGVGIDRLLGENAR